MLFWGGVNAFHFSIDLSEQLNRFDCMLFSK